MEENIASRRQPKKSKYEDEIRPNLKQGWKLYVFTIEVGAKGWIPPSFGNSLRRVFGLKSKQLSSLADRCSEVARRCSYVIWVNRFNRDFVRFPMVLDGEVDRSLQSRLSSSSSSSSSVSSSGPAVDAPAVAVADPPTAAAAPPLGANWRKWAERVRSHRKAKATVCEKRLPSIPEEDSTAADDMCGAVL